MLSKFFLDRPVFAWVIAIFIMLVGVLAIYNLPVSQYPPIAPPSIYIQSFYPGASAETVENSVTQIIEQKMTGLDRMLYLSATSDSSGNSRVELTFAPGTDPDLAWSKVQNKLQLAMASLPEVVQRRGVTVGKATRNWLMIVNIISEDASMDGNDLRDYAQSNLEKVLARVPGVGEVEMFGSQYAMRVWLDPAKLVDYGMSVDNVVTALRSYNVEVSAGQFGGAPSVQGQRLNASIVVQSLLKTPEEFASIPLRSNQDGSIVRIRDVGRTELGTEAYDIEGFYNGKPSAGIGIRMASGANALDTADAVKAKLDEMSRYFPQGMKVVYPYDTTPFVKVAIWEVVKTLFEAIILVFLIMWLFMGNFRATLIPTIAVPVVLLGTFAVLGLFGFSINMLTMFAMVLSIGLLVDDAIVVVENVERIMREEGLSAKEATRKSMEQITSALIGIGLVLSAVFGPILLIDIVGYDRQGGQTVKACASLVAGADMVRRPSVDLHPRNQVVDVGRRQRETADRFVNERADSHEEVLVFRHFGQFIRGCCCFNPGPKARVVDYVIDPLPEHVGDRLHCPERFNVFRFCFQTHGTTSLLFQLSGLASPPPRQGQACRVPASPAYPLSFHEPAEPPPHKEKDAFCLEVTFLLFGNDFPYAGEHLDFHVRHVVLKHCLGPFGASDCDRVVYLLVFLVCSRKRCPWEVAVLEEEDIKKVFKDPDLRLLARE